MAKICMLSLSGKEESGDRQYLNEERRQYSEDVTDYIFVNMHAQQGRIIFTNELKFLIE